ncbi:MAG TPA: hypothetical protein VGX46_05995 [Vicinamibacterales bacterium]|jgi:hypothetical protein|nr:hypothetical protein [Vicinamibacterales bacterium]
MTLILLKAIHQWRGHRPGGRPHLQNVPVKSRKRLFAYSCWPDEWATTIIPGTLSIILAKFTLALAPRLFRAPSQ